MKALACILSLYILVLTVMPCNDVPTDSAMHKTELAQLNTVHEYADTDLCSPFCDCCCCVSAISHSVFSINFTCYAYSQIQLTKYLPADISNNNSSIWQPPKLS